MIITIVFMNDNNNTYDFEVIVIANVTDDENMLRFLLF